MLLYKVAIQGIHIFHCGIFAWQPHTKHYRVVPMTYCIHQHCRISGPSSATYHLSAACIMSSTLFVVYRTFFVENPSCALFIHGFSICVSCGFLCFSIFIPWCLRLTHLQHRKLHHVSSFRVIEKYSYWIRSENALTHQTLLFHRTLGLPQKQRFNHIRLPSDQCGRCNF